MKQIELKIARDRPSQITVLLYSSYIWQAKLYQIRGRHDHTVQRCGLGNRQFLCGLPQMYVTLRPWLNQKFLRINARGGKKPGPSRIPGGSKAKSPARRGSSHPTQLEWEWVDNTTWSPEVPFWCRILSHVILVWIQKNSLCFSFQTSTLNNTKIDLIRYAARAADEFLTSSNMR